MSSEIDYLLSLQAVRERSARVFKFAEQGALNHFHYDPNRLQDVADFVVRVISRDFGPDRYHEIPPHGRWQHFDIGGVDRVSAFLGELQGDDKKDQTKALLDLFFVSVLLDAGAGHEWRFTEPGTDQQYARSEGIAVASLYMFKTGAFSSKPDVPYTVDGQGLANLDRDSFLASFQISSENPMLGIDSRLQLLRDVGKSLLSLPEIFGPEGRPGNLVDYLVNSAGDSQLLDYAKLWSSLQKVLIPAWPKTRTHIDGHPVGDAWPLELLKQAAAERGQVGEAASIQPFHKLTQWLAYSLTVPFMRIMGLNWTNMELGTGLPEYRNGGLFVDLKVLQLKEETLLVGQKASGEELPLFDATSDVIVEWRAMTVALLDLLHQVIQERFEKQGVKLTMAQMLEAGSWKSGRELAALHRPATKSSPILIDGDGTLF
ncbi:hypothetical protein GQ53DRAFT_708734 [Thozetella sp. PMI_491]|nr:hypothetical protein GQ53DRAFT_708734 [Thozetella sp. PMI_491]